MASPVKQREKLADDFLKAVTTALRVIGADQLANLAQEYI